MRRIRNAYLPAITTAVVFEPDDTGSIVGAKDVAHTLFDSDRDPVSQIEKLLGVQNNS